jgi:signal peptidase I
MRAYALSEKTVFSIRLAPSRSQVTESYRRILLFGTALLLAYSALYAYPRLVVISGSMTPTIPVGSVIVADRISYLDSSPKRGDIVVFRPVNGFSETQWSHRIIGLPGDTVRVWGGHVSVNGQAIGNDTTSDPDLGYIVVPKGYYYEKGDNLDAINGLVPASAVMGKIISY